jgi:PAS domain-containing protein
MDGIVAAQHVHAARDVAVVFVTAFADEATLERVRSAPSYGVLVKPFDGRALVATLRTALARFREESTLRAELALRTRVSAGLASTMSDAAIVVGTGGRVLLWNAAAGALLGASTREAVGATLASLGVELPPAGDTPAVRVASVRARSGASIPCVLAAFRPEASPDLACYVGRALGETDPSFAAQVAGDLAVHLGAVLTGIGERAATLARDLESDPVHHAAARLVQRQADGGLRIAAAGGALLIDPEGGTTRLGDLVRDRVASGELATRSLRVRAGDIASDLVVGLSTVSARRLIEALAAFADESMTEGGTLTLSVSVQDVEDLAIVPAVRRYAVLRAEHGTAAAAPGSDVDLSPDGPRAGVWVRTVVRLARLAGGSVDVVHHAGGTATSVYLPVTSGLARDR